MLASKRTGKKISIYATDSGPDELEYFLSEVKRLLADGYAADDIVVLYRRSKMFIPYRQLLQKSGIGIKGHTIHASKGLEARVVFIIGLKEGNGGFPDIWLNDRIFQVVREVRHDMLLEEERRLFDVALTRAKDELFLITRKGNESSFLEEIPEEYAVSHNHTGRQQPEAVMLCTSCKAQLQSGYRFCPFCGAA